MRGKNTRVTLCGAYLVAVLAGYTGTASAHGLENHTKEHTSVKQMARLHTSMQLYEAAQVLINAAFEKGELKTTEVEIERMIKTIPDLKKARPHKGLKQLETYKRLAADFDKDLRQTLTLVKQGNLTGAKQAFTRAAQKCTSCHAKFRD